MHDGMARTAQTAPHRGVQVELVAQWRRRRVTVSLRSLRTQRILFACSCLGDRGAEFATLSAERFCAERGYVLVMPAAHRPANDNHTVEVGVG